MNTTPKKNSTDLFGSLLNVLGLAFFVSQIRNECKKSKAVRTMVIDALEKFVEELKQMK